MFPLHQDRLRLVNENPFGLVFPNRNLQSNTFLRVKIYIIHTISVVKGSIVIYHVSVTIDRKINHSRISDILNTEAAHSGAKWEVQEEDSKRHRPGRSFKQAKLQKKIRR